jgi:hypothetical protein
MHVGMSLTLNVSVYTNNTSHNLIFMPQNDHIYIYIYIQTYIVNYAEIILVGEHALFF